MLSEEQKAISNSFLVPFESAQQLRDWVFIFLGIDFPLGRIDPDSNSSPSEWLFDAYTAIRDNLGNVKPTYVVYSSRDSYKTLSCAALEVIVLVHFQLTIAHMAAIEPQSKKAVQYINNFLRRIKPHLEYHGRGIESQNTRNIAIKNEEGEICYLTIIICTLTGANCISPDTVIHYHDGTSRPAKNVGIGDILKTWDYSEHKMVPVVVGNLSYTKKHSREIVFEDGSNVVVSDDHQVFTQKGWIPAGKVHIGDAFTEFEGGLPERTDVHPQSPDFGSLDQFIKGSLLGNSSLYKTTNKVRFQVSHCEAQLPYLESIRSLFSRHNIESAIVPDKDGQYKLTTKTNPIFEEYTHIYKEVKSITRKWLDGLTYEGIAYWFMGDGNGNGRTVGKDKDNRFTLATCCFSREENQIIVDYFTDLGYPCKISRTSNGKKSYDIVEFTLESSRDLSDRIRPFFIPELEYKLLPSKSLNFTRCLKTGSVINELTGKGFSYTGDSPHKTRTGRQWVRRIKEDLTAKVVEINLIGQQDLLDIHIDTDNEHHKSFLANNMKLLHNSEHTNLMVIDEVDVVRFPQAYEEAKLIPGVLRGRHPITIMTSTRKFAFGLMQKEIEIANEYGHPVLHWNILDITEVCPPSRHLPEEEKEIRYVAQKLPLRNISEEEWQSKIDEVKDEYTKLEAYSGCKKCSLLPVCKMRLAHRPKEDEGGLYKPIDFTINQFRKVNPDMGEAQLLCWKPSSTGLVYGRFDGEEGENVLTLDQAYAAFTGVHATGILLDDIIEALHRKGIPFYVGGDWGYRHAYALVACAKLPSGDTWMFETLAIPGLEYEDMIKYALYFRDKYQPKKWFMDTSQPMFIKGFRRRRMPCKDFKKDVMGGIEAVRGHVVDASNKRRLKVLKTPENDFLIKGFGHHHFMVDAAGNVTQEPDDEEYADVMDSIRYIGQNLFSPRGNIRAGGGSSKSSVNLQKRRELYEKDPMKIHSDVMVSKIRKLAVDGAGDSKGKSSTGQVLWDFSDPYSED